MADTPLLSGDPDAFVELLDAIPAVVALFRGPELKLEFANPRYRRAIGERARIGVAVREVFKEERHAPLLALLEQVYATGVPSHTEQAPGIEVDPDTGEERDAFYTVSFLPLRHGEEIVGAMLYAHDVTTQVRAREAAQEMEERYRRLVEANVVGVAIADAERFLEANDVFLDALGYTREDLTAGRLDWRALTPPEWAQADAEAVQRLIATGRTDPYEKEYWAADGSRVPMVVGVATLTAEPFRAVGVFVDISERRRSERERELLLAREREARQAAEDAAERTARLLRVTVAVSAAITADEVGAEIVAAGTQLLGADAGTLGFVGADGETIELSHAVGYQESKLRDFWVLPLAGAVPVSDAVRTGELVLVETFEDWERMYPAMAPGIEEFPTLAVIPLRFQSRTLGAMMLSFRTAQAFGPAERDLMLALGRQCGLAVERARLYEERAYVARTLQEGLLPSSLATPPGLDVGVAYHSISDGGSVGGDFYDLFAAGPGSWVVVMGDVCGKGTTAAVLSGLARHTIRAIAMRESEPAAVLAFLNRAVLMQVDVPSFVTVACGRIDVAPDGRVVLTLASGGHPSPILLRSGEPARELRADGTLIGIEPEPYLTTSVVELQSGDLVVLYTDGILEARAGCGRELFGESRLIATLETVRSGTAQEVVDAVDETVRAYAPGPPRDDRAVLAFRVL